MNHQPNLPEKGIGIHQQLSKHANVHAILMLG